MAIVHNVNLYKYWELPHYISMVLQTAANDYLKSTVESMDTLLPTLV
jgi:hypothetical protein